jgi:hypothetical protein
MIYKYGYIYLRNNELCELKNIIKLGITASIKDRDGTYITSEHKRGKFIYVIEIPFKYMHMIDNYLKEYLKEYHNYIDGGTEYYNKSISTLIEPYLTSINIEYRVLNENEINNFERSIRINKLTNLEENNYVLDDVNINTLIYTKLKIKKLTKLLRKYIRQLDFPKFIEKLKNNYIWKEREYQRVIIDYSINELQINKKIYIDLPTGAGKSYIVYNLFKYLQSNFIIIVSPRKEINKQNVGSKYLQLLTNKFKVLNYSSNTKDNLNNFVSSDGNKIIICCTQSIDKIYNTLIENDINNISVWFDEAHWGVENWINELQNDEVKQFMLLNETQVSYRIFTSASPDENKVKLNQNIFGLLYSYIKVHELIRLEWLAPIKPLIYSENIDNVDNLNFIFNDFIEYKRTFGFCFHNKQKNAFELFYKHYIKYKNNEIFIKPYLLVGNDFKDPRLLNICLDYNYRNIKDFENNICSIGYVVAQYNMGYDFDKLDFICFIDPKISVQDIKQCIGRGIRSDKLGIGGRNSNKYLLVSLPTYVDNTFNNNPYENIVYVLDYLLYNVEIPLSDFIFKDRYITNNINNTSHISDVEYKGDENIKSKILDLLELRNRRQLTYEQVRNIVKSYNVSSKKQYYQLCEIDKRLPKDPENLFQDDFINWIEYLGIEKIYYNLQICRQKINEYLLLYPELKEKYLNLEYICNVLCKLDELFPSNDLWLDYYNVTKLEELIYINKRKKISNIF